MTKISTPTGCKGAAVADAAAATATNPTAPAALTAVTMGDLDATTAGWGASSEVNFDKLNTAVDALIADAAASRNEIVSYETAISALIVDVAALRSTLNALIASLESTEIIHSV